MGTVVYRVYQEGENWDGKFASKTKETFDREEDAENYAYFLGLCDTIDESESEDKMHGGYFVESHEVMPCTRNLYIGVECNRDEKGYWYYSVFPERSPRRPQWYFGGAVYMAIPFRPDMTPKQAKRTIRRNLVNFLAREAKKGRGKHEPSK